MGCELLDDVVPETRVGLFKINKTRTGLFRWGMEMVKRNLRQSSSFRDRDRGS